jgi:vacuolar-type H+-ATPase subunit H
METKGRKVVEAINQTKELSEQTERQLQQRLQEFVATVTHGT